MAKITSSKVKEHSNSTNQSIRVQHYFGSAVKTFSLYDNVRSIPRLTDGLKPSQRKAICGTLSRGESASELQLERLASIIAACFPGETLVSLANGEKIRIDEIVERHQAGENIKVLSFDEATKTFVTSSCTNAFFTKEVCELITLTLEDGSTVSLTSDHRLLTARGWIEAKDLTCEDNLISM